MTGTDRPARSWYAFPVSIPWLPGLLALVTLVSCNAGTAPHESPAETVTLFGSQQLAIVVNDNDPLSVRIADYYRDRRRIPAENLIHVRFTPGRAVMPRTEFETVMADVNRQVPATVQAYALAWTLPYRVACLSITTAFAAGYDEAFCAQGCKATRASPYFNSDSRRPFDDHGWRPAMLLAGTDFDAVQSLIDRGMAADGSRPRGSAYLLSTRDRARNVRARFFPGIALLQSDRFDIKIIEADALRHRTDVLFYFTGRARVDDIDTNGYRPGALADHLTSAGGKLDGSNQMSSLRWLEAGASGSYGTVVEPCAFVQKFPRPDIAIDRYLDGETLIEAYWKSVAWPGQGVFIGEPLAAPFAESASPAFEKQSAQW